MEEISIRKHHIYSKCSLWHQTTLYDLDHIKQFFTI